MLDNRTTRTQTTTSGNFNNSTSTLSPEPMIQVPLSAFQTMNQQTQLNPEELTNKAFFSLKHMFIIIGAVGIAVTSAVTIYLNLTSDIKDLNSKVDDLAKKYSSINDSKYKDDFYEMKVEVKGLKQQLESYNFKSLNDEIVKINTQITSMKNEMDKNTDKITNHK